MIVWPSCMSESDQWRGYPGCSPCTMRSWVLSPRALICTAVGRIKRWRSVLWCAALTEVRGRSEVSFVLFCDSGCEERWNTFYSAAEMDMNRLSLWFSDTRQIRQEYTAITVSAESVILSTRSPWTTCVLLLVCYISRIFVLMRQMLLWIRENL